MVATRNEIDLGNESRIGWIDGKAIIRGVHELRNRHETNGPGTYCKSSQCANVRTDPRPESAVILPERQLGVADIHDVREHNRKTSGRHAEAPRISESRRGAKQKALGERFPGELVHSKMID